MYQTTYHRPSSVAEAAKLLASAEDAKLLAGGQTLLPTMKQRLAAPKNLIDLGKLAELKGRPVEDVARQVRENARRIFKV